MHSKNSSLPLIVIGRPKHVNFVSMPSTRTNFSRNRQAGTIKKILLKSRDTKRQGCMEQYKGPIGLEAKMEFYESFKHLPLITERNKFDHLENSPNIAYLQEVETKHLKPQPFGIVRAKGSESCIDLHGFSIGDNYASALSKGLQHVNSIENVNLKNNRLTEKGAYEILTRLVSCNLKELNLSDNKLGLKPIEIIISIVAKDDSSLVKLNLENVSTKEIYIANLVEHFKNNISLTSVNLAKNGLTRLTAQVIRDALSENSQILKLDLHWNNFCPASGAMIFEGIEKNYTLRELDLSWNSIGSNATSEEIEKIASVVAKQRELLHLDLSYNYFTVDESRILGEALKHNHQILGLHMEGNNCKIDSNGFLVTETNQQMLENGLLFRRMFKQKKLTDNCWICGKWVEVKLVFSLNRPPPVFIHFDCDNFAPYILFNQNNKYEITRALPPKTVNFFLSNNTEVFLSTEHIVIDTRYGYTHNLPNGSIAEFKKMNSFKPKGIIMNVKNPFDTRPRFRDIYTHEKTEERIPWKFETSIFKDYVRETQKILDNCFELDWGMSRLDTFVRDPKDKKKTKAYLKSMYVHLRLCYKTMSSFSGSEVFSIGSNTVTDFLYQCNIIDQYYLVSDFGVNWNSTNVPTRKDQLFNPGSALVRYELLEMILRIANDKYVRNKLCKNVHKSIKKLMEDHILPSIANYQNNTVNSMNSNWWRDTLYLCEEVDLVLKCYKSILDPVFQKYSGRKTLPGCKKFMCLEEFYDLCKDSELLTDSICNREVSFCYVQAMMTQVDEYYKKKHFEMNFVEFLEALSRVCDMRDTEPGKSLKVKLEKSLQNLIKLVPKYIQEAFSIPNEDTYHGMMYKSVVVY